MKKQILIVGSGFSGMWAAVSAARLSALEGNNSLSIAVLAPVPPSAIALMIAVRIGRTRLIDQRVVAVP